MSSEILFQRNNTIAIKRKGLQYFRTTENVEHEQHQHHVNFVRVVDEYYEQTSC